MLVCFTSHSAGLQKTEAALDAWMLFVKKFRKKWQQTWGEEEDMTHTSNSRNTTWHHKSLTMKLFEQTACWQRGTDTGTFLLLKVNIDDLAKQALKFSIKTELNVRFVRLLVSQITFVSVHNSPFYVFIFHSVYFCFLCHAFNYSELQETTTKCVCVYVCVHVCTWQIRLILVLIFIIL